MGVTADVVASVRGELTRAADLADTRARFALRAVVEMSDGTLEGQADLAFLSRGEIDASDAVEYDLSKGPLLAPDGTPCDFVDIVAILVVAANGNAHDLIVGGATHAFIGPLGAATHTVSVQPGGIAFFVAPGDGWTSTDNDGDVLRIANSGSVSVVSYDIAVIGRSGALPEPPDGFGWVFFTDAGGTNQLLTVTDANGDVRPIFAELTA